MKKYYLIIPILFFSIVAFSQTISVTDSSQCEAITKEFDEFKNETKFEAEFNTSGGGSLSFIKYKKGIASTYYLSIWIKESGIYTGKGVIIILTNGKRINKPNAEVEYNYAANSFYSTTFITLSAADIALLKESGIAKYQLYISKDDFSDYSDDSKTLFNCLVKAK